MTGCAMKASLLETGLTVIGRMCGPQSSASGTSFATSTRPSTRSKTTPASGTAGGRRQPELQPWPGSTLNSPSPALRARMYRCKPSKSYRRARAACKGRPGPAPMRQCVSESNHRPRRSPSARTGANGSERRVVLVARGAGLGARWAACWGAGSWRSCSSSSRPTVPVCRWPLCRW